MGLRGPKPRGGHAPVFCTACGARRPRGGNARQGVCRACHLAGLGTPRSKTQKPGAHQQFEIEHRAAKESRYPTESWWTRPDFSAALAQQMDRFRAAGIGRDRPALGMPASERVPQ